MELTAVREVAMHLRQQVHRVVVGQDHAIDLLLVALLCEGHILFEGVPGTAKTLLTRTFAGRHVPLTLLKMPRQRIAAYTPERAPAATASADTLAVVSPAFIRRQLRPASTLFATPVSPR